MRWSQEQTVPLSPGCVTHPLLLQPPACPVTGTGRWPRAPGRAPAPGPMPGPAEDHTSAEIPEDALLGDTLQGARVA